MFRIFDATFAIVCASIFATAAHAAPNLCPHQHGKKIKERFSDFAYQLTCHGTDPVQIQIFGISDRKVFQGDLRDRVLHGSVKFYDCDQQKCWLSAELFYAKGKSEGAATLYDSTGVKTIVNFQGGVMHGRFRHENPTGVVTGTITDGVVSVEGAKSSSFKVATLRMRSPVLWADLNAPAFAYLSFNERHFGRYGFRAVRMDGANQVVYQFGLRMQVHPINYDGKGLAYVDGVPHEELFWDGGFLTRKRGVSESTWTQVDSRPSRFKHTITVPGIGYGSAKRLNFDLSLLFGQMDDLVWAGIGLMVARYTGDDGYYIVSGAAAFAPWFLTSYLSVGARTNGKVTAPDFSLGVGLAILVPYVRLSPPKSELGRPVEFGLSLKWPLR